MNPKTNFVIRINYNNFKEIPKPIINNSYSTDVYILCKKSFFENVTHINSENLLSELPKASYVKTDFNFNEIMPLKNELSDFYIFDYCFLSTKNPNIKCISNVSYFEHQGKNILYFKNDDKYIIFKPERVTNAQNFNINENIQNISNSEFNNLLNNQNNNFGLDSFNDSNNIINYDIDKLLNQQNLNQNQQFQNQNKQFSNQNIKPNYNAIKKEIFNGLILLYGNEIEIMRAYSQGNSSVQKFFLINKELIDKFKESFNYNNICKIKEIKEIKNLNECFSKLKSFESSYELQNIYNGINPNIMSLKNYSLMSGTQIIGENEEYNFPINFEIVHESILNLLKKHINAEYSTEYEIKFGKELLCIRTNDKNKMYIYRYIKKVFNLIGIIDLFADVYNYIFNKYLIKEPFYKYLKDKNIDINITNTKQNLFSSGNKHLGYIYLLPEINIKPIQEENILVKEKDIHTNFGNLSINENNNRKFNFHLLYDKLLKILNSYKCNNLDFSNIENIKYYLTLKQIAGLNLFVITNEKCQYLFNYIKQFEGTNADYSLFISSSDIVPYEQISPSIKYSFINEEICKYLKIQNLNYLPKVFTFKNLKGNIKSIYIYYSKQDCFLKVVNYHHNSFNIEKISKQKTYSGLETINNNKIFTNNDISTPIEQAVTSEIYNQSVQTYNNHALGLENIGATCYMNATLQCLCHVSLLKDYFLDNDQKYKQDTLSKSASLTKSFVEVLTQIWKNQNNEVSYAPRNFKNLISQMNPLFQGIQANDSKDLVLFIYETIHNELNNPSQNPGQINLQNIPNELVQFRQNYYSQNYSIISKIFYYEQSNIMECQNCHYKTYNFNIMNIIIFPLEKVRLYLSKRRPNGFTVVTLNDCFEQNQEKEMLEGANQIYCNQCHQNANASSFTQLYTCPEVLTIILNRGKGLEFDVNFSFPMELTLEKYVQDKSYVPNYELIGCLTHHGPSGMAGHFVAYCKSPVDNQWYFYNDAQVTPCHNAENEMNSNGIPYILFYQRRKTQYIQYDMNNININVNDDKPKCIYFTYEGKEGYYEYTDDNKMLYDAYNEFCNKYDWAPRGQRLMLMKNNNMIDLEEYKGLAENGINNEDKICIINN